MHIVSEFAPPIGRYTSEEIIHRRGATRLLNEIKAVIRETKLHISSRRTTKTGGGVTGNPKLSEALNEAFKMGLRSLSWEPKTAPGALHFSGKIDYYKEIATGLVYGPQAIGIGVEVQFGNNYQTNEDYKKLAEFFITREIIAGIEIVPSDLLAEYKADRGSFFTDAKKKLIRFMQIYEGLGALEIPPIVILGIEHDGFSDNSEGKFSLIPAEITQDEKGELIADHKPDIGTITT
jgi:hypothetical protein